MEATKIEETNSNALGESKDKEVYNREEKLWDEEYHKRKEMLTKVQKKFREQEIGEEEWRKRRNEYREFMDNRRN